MRRWPGWTPTFDAHGAVALGEIGLDYHYDFSPRPIQQEVFRRQLELAGKRDLPVVIHTREATDDTFRTLRDHGTSLRVCFIVSREGWRWRARRSTWAPGCRLPAS